MAACWDYSLMCLCHAWGGMAEGWAQLRALRQPSPWAPSFRQLSSEKSRQEPSKSWELLGFCEHRFCHDLGARAVHLLSYSEGGPGTSVGHTPTLLIQHPRVFQLLLAVGFSWDFLLVAMEELGSQAKGTSQ